MRNKGEISSQQLLITGGSLIIFLTVIHIAIDTVSSMLTALLPIIQDRFGLSETVLALLVATLSFSSSMTQPLFGALSDRFGSRLIGTLGILLNAVLLSLIGVVPTVPLLFAVLLVGGLGSAAFHPAGTSMARAAYIRNSGLAVSLFGAGGTLSLALGPVLVLSVVATFGLSFTPWLMIPGVILGVLTYFVMPPLERTPRDHQHRFFDRRLFAGPVRLLCVAGILSYISAVTFSSAMPLWLVQEQGVARDDTLIGWTLAAFSLSAAVGGVTAGALSTRVSRRMLVSGTMLGVFA
jgi:FSR family fosmidomycin resistance protein-like MFS transporter